jgi:imidazolonepropionase
MWDVLWTHARVARMAVGDLPYGLIDDGAIAIAGDRIAWVGASSDLPRGAEARESRDAEGRCITPGLIDPHTHIVYGGNRAAEFEQRLLGATYEEIAAQGGGILSTARATRAAGEDALFASARKRVAQLCAEGVTTVEIKSGYGLDRDTELAMLRTARRLGESLPITVRTTFLGAHTVPPEFRGRGDDYVAFLCDELLPAAAGEGLVDAVDAFCERIAFSPEQTSRVFEAAEKLGLPVKLHADQLTDGGGAALAARYHALSADHLEHTSDAGVAALAASGTVATLLPGAYYFLRETKAPPIASLRAHGVPIALATDSNPGTSPTTSLLLMLNMACTVFRLTPGEALAGVTRNAARALGLDGAVGTLAVGKKADLVVWDVEHPAELAYNIGGNPCHAVYRHGVPRWRRQRA